MYVLFVYKYNVILCCTVIGLGAVVRNSQINIRFNFHDYSFRVVTYNVLSSVYTDTDLGKAMFNSCPEYAISLSYRKLLLLKEISGKCSTYGYSCFGSVRNVYRFRFLFHIYKTYRLKTDCFIIMEVISFYV